MTAPRCPAHQTSVPSTGRWEVAFTGMPPSPNARLHYMARARSAKAWRQRARLYHVLLGARIPPLERVRITATLTRRTLGRADEDNDRARLKPLVDGLVDAGVIPNDTRGHIEWGPCLEAKGAPGVVLVVEALGGGEA
jgi:hypothetical protein